MKQLITVMALVLGLSISISGSHAAEDSEDQRVFYETHQPLAGLYEFANEQIVIGLIARADIIYFQRLSTGDMRFMAEDDGNYKFRYSPTRNSTDLTEGRVAFRMSPSGETLGLTWTDAAGVQHVARRVARRNEEVQFENGKEAVLRGSLIVPEGDGPFPAVVLIPQADRTDLWDVGMWLFSRGLAVLAYDQRNSEVGLSTGKEAAGGYQDQQKTYAGDAIAAVRFLQSRGDIDARRVGVIGWSGGGFTGAMVAGEMSGLGFYVSIAGDASPGFEQASHMFVARLMREGFSDEDVEAGRRLVDMHFGVAEGRVTWKDYQGEVARVQDADWYQYLTGRYSIPFTKEEGILDIGRYQDRWPPERVYGKVSSVPTLGVFFEFDHSSAPSSPYHFHKSLSAAGNGNFAVVMIPDAHHGGFVVDGLGYRFDTSMHKRRSPLLIDTVVDWVERQVNLRQRKHERSAGGR